MRVMIVAYLGPYGQVNYGYVDRIETRTDILKVA